MLRLKGICMIIAGSVLWGTTGPLLEWILSNTGISVSFLLTVRLIIAGACLLAVMAIQGKDIWEVWKSPAWRSQLIIFGIFGTLGIQYTFVAAIEESNAVVATLLQFSAPIFVALYVSFAQKKLPPRYQVIGIAGTLAGLYLLLTNGSASQLLVSKEALLWGLALGITYAFYTLYPARLMQEWSILLIVGWSMLIGGLFLGLSSQAWLSDDWPIIADPKMLLLLLVLIFFSTVAFILFLNSMKYISAVETCILSSVEPLTAMVISAIWFHTMLQGIQLLGVLVMIIFVVWLSVGGQKAAIQQENVMQSV